MLKKLAHIGQIFSGVNAEEQPIGSLLFLKIRNFEDGHYAAASLPSVALNEKTQRHILCENDLLFAAKGASNFCAIYHPNEYPAIASNTFFVIRLMAEEVLPDYVRWYINLPQVIKQLQRQAMGTGVPVIAKEVLEELEIPIPPLSTQQAIVELARLQDREQQLRRQLTEKRQLLYDNLLLTAINSK